jgi:site-specific recombinase XerD
MKLNAAVDTYLEFKLALGMRMRSEAHILRAFCRVFANGNLSDVTLDATFTFLAGNGPVTRNWKQKASVLRSFYRYAIGRGLVASTPVPVVDPQFPPLRTPYIYTTAELKHLLAATAILDTPRVPLRAKSFRTLILLLYGTGLRISEALSLTLADVDRADSLITVRDTKFHKARLVPIGPKLTRELTLYARRRCRELPTPAGDESSFFALTRSGNHPNRSVADSLFSRIRAEASIRRDGSKFSQPYLHDLRHTMVQHRLLSWYRSGCDVQRLLPKLATYLGHVDVNSTQHYLTMTPELLHEASRRFERYAQPESRHA